MENSSILYCLDSHSIEKIKASVLSQCEKKDATKLKWLHFVQFRWVRLDPGLKLDKHAISRGRVFI